MRCYICGSSIHSSHNVMVDEAGLHHAGCKPQAKQEKPPLGLRPHHCWVYSRISEIMRAIIRYEDAGMAVPPEWCSELRGHLVAPNPSDQRAGDAPAPMHRVVGCEPTNGETK